MKAQQRRQAMRQLHLLLVLSAVAVATATEPAKKPPPIWPDQFHAVLVQNRTGRLTLVNMWYDFKNGRVLHILEDQLEGLFYNLEFANRTSYYFSRDPKSCLKQVYPVDILKPTWLSKATYMGKLESNGFTCDAWTVLNFITYYQEIGKGRPVRWNFFNSADFHVLRFETGKTLAEEEWQIPTYCDKPSAKPGLDKLNIFSFAFPRYWQA